MKEAEIYREDLEDDLRAYRAAKTGLGAPNTIELNRFDISGEHPKYLGVWVNIGFHPVQLRAGTYWIGKRFMFLDEKTSEYLAKRWNSFAEKMGS